MSVVHYFTGLFRSEPSPDHLAKVRAATQRVMDASERIKKKLDKEPLDEFCEDLQGSSRRRAKAK
jgi:hypothetical protein